MARRGFFISAAVCVAASYGVYSEHISYDPVAESKEERELEEKMAHGLAAEMVREQQRCLAERASHLCNSDLTYADYLSVFRTMNDEQRGLFNIVNHKGVRNIYIAISIVSGLIAAVNLSLWRDNARDKAGQLPRDQRG